MMKQRMLLTLALTAFLAVFGLGLTACGGRSSEDIIRQSVSEAFEQIKTGDAQSEMVKAVEGVMNSGQLKEFNIDADEYLKAYLDGFDYKVGDITVDDKEGTAEVKMTLTVKSAAAVNANFQTKWAAEIQRLQQNPDEVATQGDLYKRAGEVLLQSVKETETSTGEVSIAYKKNDDGEWQADQASVIKALGEVGASDSQDS